jgi:GNAT superfamily N-acetyltransferase
MHRVSTWAIERGSAADAERLLTLFDDAVAWLVARGQTAQWGDRPFSADPRKIERVRSLAADGELWFAVANAEPCGAIVLGDAHDYVPAATLPELYVQVMLTASAWRGHGVGAALIEHATRRARGRGAERLRVDCWAGVPELVGAYERLGFRRTGAFDVDGWPGAILERSL